MSLSALWPEDASLLQVLLAATVASLGWALHFRMCGLALLRDRVGARWTVELANPAPEVESKDCMDCCCSLSKRLSGCVPRQLQASTAPLSELALRVYEPLVYQLKERHECIAELRC